MPSLSEISRKYRDSFEAGIAAGAAIDPARHRQALAYAQRYADFEESVRRMRWLGYSGSRRGLDLGSGIGHWCLAFAYFGGHATGIEMRPEFVAIAEHCARAIGYADRTRFVTARIEAVDLPAGSFDAAWSHSVLMYADAEPAIEKAAAALAENGRFYIGYTTEGGRLDSIESGLFDVEACDKVGQQLTIMLNGYLHRAGVYHTVGGRVRMLRFDDLKRLCGAFGLRSVGEPGVQDLPGRYRGVPATFDLLAQKIEGSDAARDRLLACDWTNGALIDELERLLAADCPRLVCDVIATIDRDLKEGSGRDLYARALVRAGRARSADAVRVFESGSALPELTKALYAQDRGQFSEALRHHRRLGDGDPQRGFLAGCCLLQLREWTAARREFRLAIENGGEMRSWIGVVAAHWSAGDLDGARAAYRAFLQTLDWPAAGEFEGANRSNPIAVASARG